MEHRQNDGPRRNRKSVAEVWELLIAIGIDVRTYCIPPAGTGNSKASQQLYGTVEEDVTVCYSQ